MSKIEYFHDLDDDVVVKKNNCRVILCRQCDRRRHIFISRRSCDYAHESCTILQLAEKAATENDMNLFDICEYIIMNLPEWQQWLNGETDEFP